MKLLNQYTFILSGVILLVCMFWGSCIISHSHLIVLTTISLLLLLFTLFLIHHPTLQMRICIYTMIVLIGLQIWIFFSATQIKIIDLFPILCAVLIFISVGYIRQEQTAANLIKVLDKYKQKKNQKKK